MRLFLASAALLLLASLAAAEVVWSLPTADAINSGMLLLSDQLYFTSQNGKAYSVSAQDGKISWVYDAGGRVALPPVAVTDSLLAVATENGKLSLVGLDDGKRVAETSLKKPPLSLEAGGGLLFASIDDRVLAFDSKLAQAWNMSIKGGTGPLSYSQGKLLFTSKGKLHSLSAPSGAQDFATPSGDSFLSKPKVYRGIIFFGSTDGNLYALDAKTGAVRWSYKTGGWVTGTPAVSDNGVYVGSNDGSFYALSPSGNLRYKLANGGGEGQSPFLSKGTIVMATSSGKLAGIDELTGAEKWEFSAEGKPGSPLMHGEGAIFGTSSGKLYYLSYSPLCSFTYPSSLEAVGNWPIVFEGKASAESGIDSVEVRVGGRPWTVAQGQENWSAEMDFSSIPEGTVRVECRSRDREGKMEQGEYSGILVAKSESAPLQKMRINAPKQVQEGEYFLLEAKDARGRHISGITVQMDQTELVSGSPIKLRLGRSGAVRIILEKRGFEQTTVTVTGRGSQSNTLLVGIGAIALLVAAVGAYYYFFIRKRGQV